MMIAKLYTDWLYQFRVKLFRSLPAPDGLLIELEYVTGRIIIQAIATKNFSRYLSICVHSILPHAWKVSNISKVTFMKLSREAVIKTLKTLLNMVASAIPERDPEELHETISIAWKANIKNIHIR